MESAGRQISGAKYSESWKAEGAIQGVYWLPALDSQKRYFRHELRSMARGNKDSGEIVVHDNAGAPEHIGDPGTFLISATRLGGLHGMTKPSPADPLGGAVTGFTKAYKREKGDATVKVVDFEPSRKTSAFADLLLDRKRCAIPGLWKSATRMGSAGQLV